MKLLADAHDQAVVAAGGTADPDTQSAADTHKQRAQNSGQQGELNKLRPQGRELLAQPVHTGKASRADGRVGNKARTQYPKADEVTQNVYHCSGDGRGDGKPVLQQQAQSQLSTFGDTGKCVDMIKPKGQDRTAQQSEQGRLPF